MSKPEDINYKYAYDRIPEDAKIAFCLGDLDLEDITDVDLTDTGRMKLEQLLYRWGRGRGLEL